MRRDLGDFQTPPALVAAVLGRLGPIGPRWPRVLEPTCGRGEFIAGLLASSSPPREIVGVEIQDAHAERAESHRVEGDGAPGRVEILRANLFDLALGRDLRWSEGGPLLVVGNPPWVTAAELGALGSGNGPRRANVDGLRGIEAKTGAANFDIAEAVWRKLLVELADQRPTIAMLCKAATARRVLEFAGRAGLPVAGAELVRIDARAWFGAAVGACLLRIDLGGADGPASVPVYADLTAEEPDGAMGFARGRLVADLRAYRACAAIDGACPLTWRQGLKHDAAGVMELGADADGTLRNKRGEAVDVEPAFVYPLVKGSDLARPGPVPARRVLVTQTRIGEDTSSLEQRAPRLWRYLGANADAFAGRRSSVYRGRPPFALFGIGPYSFAAHKVAISGLARRSSFRALGPAGGRPVMLDDTSYFLPAPSAPAAALLAAALNDPLGLGLLDALAFRDAKRPVTKALLQRIDLRALLDRADRPALLDRAESALGRLEPTGEAPDWAAEIEALREARAPSPAPARPARVHAGPT